MVTRSRGRYLAPIAILVVIAATVVVIEGELGSKNHRQPAAHVTDIRNLTRHSRGATATFYVVKSGDSLSSISVKTGVSVPTLESLNPNVNPAALQTGQRLRLRQ
jgi:LysM repeat protein